MKTDVDFKANLSKNLYFIRGIAIVLVVIGHVIGDNKNDGMRQMYDSDILGLTWLSEFIYTFHMPIFFIASGVAFATFSSQKNIRYLEFARSKFKRLFIPLFFWLPPFCVLQSLFKDKTFSFIDMINLIIHPYSSILWFIQALIIASLFHCICFKVFNSKSIYFWASIILCILSLFLNNFLINENIFYALIYWNIFYAFGFFLAFYLPKLNLLLNKLTLHVVFLMLTACIIIMMITDYFLLVNYVWVCKIINGIIAFLFMYVLGYTGKIIIPFCLLSKLLHSVKSNFMYLGKISMAIYLLHIYFGSGTRVFLIKVFGITEPSLHFVLGFSAAILGPIICYEILKTRSKIFMYSIGEAK